MQRILIIACLSAVLIPLSLAQARATRPDGGGDFQQIQAVLDHAADQGRPQRAPGASRGMYPDWTDIPYSPFPLIPANVDNPVLTAADVTDVDATFVADPFLFRDGDAWWMFFEVYDPTPGLGKIGVASSADGLHWRYEKIVLDEMWHLSYPFVFTHDGDYYLLPSSDASGEVRLYRASIFPWVWEDAATLTSGTTCVDPTLLFQDDLWWLFVGGANSSTCRLYYSDDLLGPWTRHPSSPIATGPAHSRPGGRFFAYDGGRIIRLAQKCDEYYGEAVKAFEIDLLTPTEYHDFEIPESPVLAPSGGGWNGGGMHQCDAWWVGDHWIAAVDGFGQIGWCIGIYCSAENPAGLAPGSAIPRVENATRLICANPLGVGSSIVAEMGAGVRAGFVELSIHDLEGRLAGTLPRGASSGSRHLFTWNSADALGRHLPAGTYFLRLRAGEEEVTKRVVVVK